MADMTQLLLNMMIGARSGQNMRPMMEEMLNSDSDIDPTTRLLLTQALTQETAEGDKPDNEITLDEDDYDYVPSRRQRAIDRLRQRYAAMTQQMDEMAEEIELLQERNDDLAAALGACYFCWGQDPDCPVCNGAGAPGSIPPDPRLYKKWILPAVRAMQLGAKQRFGRKAAFVQTNVQLHGVHPHVEEKPNE